MAALTRKNQTDVPAADGGLDPVDWIVDDHFRQRTICHVLERVARNPRHGGNLSELEKASLYLEDELPLHFADEEDDLIPLLGLRCEVGDRFSEISVALRENHESERELTGAVAPELRRILAGEPLANPVQFFGNALRLCTIIRRHLVWENGVLVPLARKRLKAPDFPYLAHKMASRRGGGVSKRCAAE